MSDFKTGGVPTPDYDGDDINYIDQKTEFSEDVFCYGKLYADLGGDVQTFSTAGVERFRISKDGKVGIGTTGTDYALSIREADNNNKWLMLQKNSGQQILQFREDGDHHAIIDGSHASGELHFFTAGNERVRIDTSGQVILTSNSIRGGGIYHHKRTISTSGSQFFKLENDNGATAATIYLSASEVGFSVSKVYQFAGQHNGGSGGLNLVADSGAYNGNNINLTVNSTQDVHQFTCTATGTSVEVVVTIVVGCANHNMVFTKQ